ncbi:hypothetical protein NDA13_005277 [Ustilago tritici]|nr:hypothetical protein NDA13_005277 [Ustilago tritici]
MTHFRCYVNGAPGGFTWVTDHKGIVYFCTQHELTPHEYCYLNCIEQYDPHIMYQKGEDNVVADALSRRPSLDNNNEPSNNLKQVLVTTRRPALISPSEPTTLERLTAEETNSELAIKPGMAEAVAKSITREGHPTWLTLGSRVAVITLFERACSLTKALHDEGGHRKQSTLKNLVTDRYALPAMLAICGAVDFLSLPGLRLGNSKLITVINYCTGQAHTFPTKNENTADALRMMEQLIYRYRKLSSVISNNGSAWTSYGFRNYMCSLGIRIIYIAPYHPQTNGKVERFNGILLNALK